MIGHLWNHHVLSSCIVAIRKDCLVSNDLDETYHFMKARDRSWEKDAVNVGKGVEGNTGRRDEGKVHVKGVVNEGGSKEATLRRNQSGGASFCWPANYFTARKNASECDFSRRVTVNVDVEEVVMVMEELFPQRREMDVRVN